MLIRKQLFSIVIIVGLVGFCFTFFWAESVAFIQTFTIKKYHHENLSVKTTSKYYQQFQSQKTSQNTPKFVFKQIQNQEYLKNVFWKKFTYQDTQNSYPIPGQQLSCIPKSFGYSWQQGNKVFPPKIYQKCSELTPKPHFISILDHQSGYFSMNCSGTFVLGPADHKKLALRHEVQDLWQTQTYNEPVKTKSHHQFALSSCQNSQVLDRAIYYPKFNQSLYFNTKSRMKQLQKQHKVSHPPLIVMMLSVDSFSRKHFIRKLPLTLQYLNSLNTNSTYHIYDFLIHNIIGTNSVGNQAPILGSNLHIENIQQKYTGNLQQDFAGQQGLWNIFRPQGFISYFGIQTCDNSFARKLGRMPNIDYTTSQFYCAAYKFTDYRSSKSLKSQRCIGPHMSHWYIFNYTESLNKMYNGVNQWLYLHITAAHESTGQHSQTLDQDLRNFLKKFLENNKKNEVSLMLAADHGMRYGNWFKNVEAFQENRLPVFFFINSNSLLDRIPFSYSTLDHNSYRLNSKIDMRKTMIFLSGVPYDQKINSEQLYQSVNLLTEKIPNSRICQQIGVPPWHCGCLVLQVLPKSLYDGSEQSELGELVKYLAGQAVQYLNDQLLTYSGKPFLCKRLSLQSIDSAYGLALDNNLEELKIQVSVQESVKAKFEVTFIVSSADDYMSNEQEGFPVNAFIYNSYRKKWRILSMQRIDRYEGQCEFMAREVRVAPQFCICYQDQILEAKNPKFYKEFIKKYQQDK